MVQTEINHFCEQKASIKQSMKLKAEAKQATRIIESDSRRIVHFIFNPNNCEAKVTPFTRKLKLFLEGDLEAFEAEEHAQLEKYLESYVDEALDDNEKFPVIYEKNDFYELELNDMDHIAFAVADNPFFKMDTEKYYPECVVMNNEGEILAHLSADKRIDNESFPSLKYKQGFRDEMMRVNDDRKIEMRLSEFKDSGLQVLFFIRSNDLRKERDIIEGAYKEAWYRVQNETTSQTIDYKKIDKLGVPDDYNETKEDVEEGQNDRNELIYIIGRVYRDQRQKKRDPKWVYERYNQHV